MSSRSHPPSFRALFEAQVGFVWRTLRRLGVPERELEDAVQEVFSSAHRRWGEFDERTSVHKFLSLIAREVARDARQKGNLRRGLLGPGMNDPFHELVSDDRTSVPPGTAWVESMTTGKQQPPPLSPTLPPFEDEGGIEPSLDARARMLAQLEGALGSASMAPPAATAKLLWLSLSLGLSVVLGGAALLVQNRDDVNARGPTRSVAAARARAAPASLPPARAPNAPGPALVHAASPARRAAPAANAEPRRAARADGHVERTLLEAARDMLPTRAAYALELVAEHARTYPQSRHGEQRELIAIEALRLLGRTSAARERARSFEQSFPSTEARARLQRALGAQ